MLAPACSPLIISSLFVAVLTNAELILWHVKVDCIPGGWAQVQTAGMCCRVDAGKVELDGAQYLGFRLPFTISQLCWIEAILVGGAEVYRNGELNSEKRIYPGEPACFPPCPGVSEHAWTADLSL